MLSKDVPWPSISEFAEFIQSGWDVSFVYVADLLYGFHGKQLILVIIFADSLY